MPSETEWKKKMAGKSPAAAVSDSNNTQRYNSQLQNKHTTFLVSLESSLCYKTMFENMTCCTEYDFLQDRLWGDSGNWCYDIKMKFIKPTTGQKVKRIVETYVRAMTPGNLKEKVFAVVKSWDYVMKKNSKEFSLEPQAGPSKENKAKKAKCLKCQTYDETGQARGVHSKACRHYKKPESKKTKEQKAYQESVDSMMGED